MILLVSQPSEDKKWKQKCQLVVKDHMPSWSAMLAMKQLAGQIATGAIFLAEVKMKRDLLLGEIQKGRWLTYMAELGPKEEWFTSSKFVSFVTARYQQQSPAGLMRAQPLVPDDKQVSGADVEDTRPEAAAPRFHPKPPVENPDTADTQPLI